MLKNYIITNLLFRNQLGGKNNIKMWDTLSHNGVMFPPEYKIINIPLIYDGKDIILNKEAEEAATFYAKFLESEYIKNPKFNKNFWNDFKKFIETLEPRRVSLIKKRNLLQSKIDSWYQENKYKFFDEEKYKKFLEKIGYYYPKEVISI